MAVAKWNTPSAQSADVSGSTLNSLANNTTSGFFTYDNSTNLDGQAHVEIALASLVTTTGASLTLRAYAVGGSTPDDIGSVGGGETYNVPVTVGSGAKVVTIPMVRLYPFSMRFQITNNTGVAFASSGNTVKFRPFNEAVG